jgi:hypothetical protein
LYVIVCLVLLLTLFFVFLNFHHVQRSVLSTGTRAGDDGNVGTTTRRERIAYDANQQRSISAVFFLLSPGRARSGDVAVRCGIESWFAKGVLYVFYSFEFEKAKSINGGTVSRHCGVAESRSFVGIRVEGKETIRSFNTTRCRGMPSCHHHQPQAWLFISPASRVLSLSPILRARKHWAFRVAAWALNTW